MLHPRTFPYVSELKQMIALLDSKNECEGRGQTELAAVIRTELLVKERLLSPSARRWWFEKSSRQLAAHLRRFVPAYKWKPGRDARWVGRRWVRNSQSYGTRICAESDSHDEPPAEYTLR